MSLTPDEEAALEVLIAHKNAMPRPVTVTHCGSSGRCRRRFAEMRLADTLANKKVFSIGVDTHSDTELAATGVPIDKDALDALHLSKIDDSDEVLVLDVADDDTPYKGESTRREEEEARRLGKRLRYYSQERPTAPRLLVPVGEHLVDVRYRTLEDGYGVSSETVTAVIDALRSILPAGMTITTDMGEGWLACELAGARARAEEGAEQTA